jgi:hypothetical protein
MNTHKPVTVIPPEPLISCYPDKPVLALEEVCLTLDGNLPRIEVVNPDVIRLCCGDRRDYQSKYEEETGWESRVETCGR